MKIKVLRALSIALSLMLCCNFFGFASSKVKKNKKETKYDKLFKGKKYDVAKGKFASLYKIDSKVYLELPLERLNKKMLLSASISSVSDATVLSVGSRNENPLFIKFNIKDSSVVMQNITNTLVYDKTQDRINKSIDLNYADPNITSFNILAYNNDSTAIVFDFSSFVAKDNRLLPLIPKNVDMYSLSASAKSDLNFVKSIKAYDDNIMVKTDMTYLVSASIMGIIPIATNAPVSIEASFNLAQMNEEQMPARISDPRVGISSSNKVVIPKNYESIKAISYAHRWRIEPKDEKAFNENKISEVKKPIIFYLDPAIPNKWKEAVKEGVLMWNKAFEVIGFKNAIQVADFPDNEDFDADNIKFSSIRYVPNSTQDVRSSYSYDPQTGEILNANIFIYNNIEELIRDWRFIQTANIDKSVRSHHLSKELLNESLRAIIAHEVGRCLGLEINLASSSAYQSDKLRSAEFTKRNGLSPSIMDYTRYNYIAQSSDKGAKLANTDLGVYDYYAIQWNYSYFPKDRYTEEEIKSKLDSLVSSKENNPLYRFAPNQMGNIYDPSVIAEDLGNNPIKSSDYGIKNLNNITKNLDKWISNDEDSRLKNKLYLQLAQQYYKYLGNVMNMIGGMYLYESSPNNTKNTFKVLDTQSQRKALKWSLKHIINFQSFANRNLERKSFMRVSYFDQLLEYISKDFFSRRFKVAVSSYLDPKSYSQKDYFNDSYDIIFNSLKTGKKPNDAEMLLQKYFISLAQMSIKGSAKAPNSSKNNLTIYKLYWESMNKFGYIPSQLKEYISNMEASQASQDLAPNISPAMVDKSSVYIYGLLLKLEPELEKAIKHSKTDDIKAHYQLLLYKVKLLLNKDDKTL